MAKIAVLVGTSRQGSFTSKVAEFVNDELLKSGLTTTLVLPKDYLTTPVTARSGKELQKTEWSKIMEASDGLVIVTPEYNHGYPGELKLMLDQLYDEYLGKPVLVCGVSDGDWGGVRAVENLIPVLVTLGLYPLRKGVYFPHADKLEYNNIQLTRSIEKLKDYLKMLGKT